MVYFIVMMRTCKICGKTKDESEFGYKIYDGHIFAIYTKRVCKKCVNEERRRKRRENASIRNAEISRTGKYRKKLKHDLLTMYGTKCSRCGYDNEIALCIHHSNGGGGEERKNGYIGRRMYRKLLKEPKRKDIEVLCMNCHTLLHSGYEE